MRLWHLGLALALAWGGWQRHQGAQAVRAQWSAAELAAARAAENQAAEQRALAARAAVLATEAGQQIQQRSPEARRAVTTALRQPLQCPPPAPGEARGADLALADVRVPAAVVDGLRRAGADPAPAP